MSRRHGATAISHAGGHRQAVAPISLAAVRRIGDRPISLAMIGVARQVSVACSVALISPAVALVRRAAIALQIVIGVPPLTTAGLPIDSPHVVDLARIASPSEIVGRAAIVSRAPIDVSMN